MNYSLLLRKIHLVKFKLYNSHISKIRHFLKQHAFKIQIKADEI